MPSPMLSEPVVIVNAGQSSSPYRPGSSRPDWGAAARHTAYGFITQRGISDEAPDSARTEDGTRWAAVLNGDPPVTQDSRIEYGGEVFRVVVRPKRVAVRGVVKHVELVLMPLGEVA